MKDREIVRIERTPARKQLIKKETGKDADTLSYGVLVMRRRSPRSRRRARPSLVRSGILEVATDAAGMHHRF
jgi:hypothetical protein